MSFRIKILTVIIFSIVSCAKPKKNNTTQQESKLISQQDSTKIKHYLSKAFKQELFSQERQQYLDSVLQITPNNAYLWQQKAMPLFKSNKHEIGMKYINKAVAIAPKKYLDYRAFIKCIFSKNYYEAISDFLDAKKLNGENAYVMDHSYNFYIGLSYLQLNKFEKANEYLKLNIANELKSFNENWVPTLDWFYLGISEFELHNYEEAIINLDKALIQYPNFVDAQYYKIKCLARLNKISEAKLLLEIAQKSNFENNTFNEGNSIYERYPYQIYKAQLQHFRD